MCAKSCDSSNSTRRAMPFAVEASTFSQGLTISMFGFLAVLCAQTRLCAGEPNLETVRLGHRSTIQRIVSLYCRIHITDTTTGGAGTSMSAEYWRSLDSFRIKYKSGLRKFDAIRQGDRVRVLTRQRSKDGKEEIVGQVRQFRGEQLGPCDVWQHALFTFFRPGSKALLSFDELLAMPKQLDGILHKREGDRVYVVVRLSHAPWRYEIWFDPHVNFLVAKTIFSTATGDVNSIPFRRETKVTGFKEIAPGLFFPEQVKSQIFKDGKFTGSRIAKFSDVQVNQRQPPDIFELRFPGGITIVDQIEGKRYQTHESGKAVPGTEDPIRGGVPLPANAVQRTETRQEPERWTRWVLWASLGILALAGTAWLYQRWRRSSATVRS
jgi:hypothetical protein